MYKHYISDFDDLLFKTTISLKEKCMGMEKDFEFDCRRILDGLDLI